MHKQSLNATNYSTWRWGKWLTTKLCTKKGREGERVEREVGRAFSTLSLNSTLDGALECLVLH